MRRWTVCVLEMRRDAKQNRRKRHVVGGGDSRVDEARHKSGAEKENMNNEGRAGAAGVGSEAHVVTTQGVRKRSEITRSALAFARFWR